MTDTEVVPRMPDRRSADRPPLVDAATADQLLAKAQAEGVELLGPEGLLSQLTKAVLERAVEEEMTAHRGYEKHDPTGRGSGNSRNRTTGKTLLTELGGIDLDVPSDRNCSFAPQIARKGQTRLDGFTVQRIALYARGLSTRNVRAQLWEMYGVEVPPGPDQSSDRCRREELTEWQPLDPGQFLTVVANPYRKDSSCRVERGSRLLRRRSVSSSS